MRILVTGAAGFVGSAFVRRTIKHRPDVVVVAFARNSIQRNLIRLTAAMDSNHMQLIFGDLLGDISGLCEDIDVVVNFAAKTFVDHSIKDPLAFVDSNVVGTARLLEEARRQRVGRFVHVSTDEVYGSIEVSEACEMSPVYPSNPYAASKAAADAMVVSYTKTYDMWTAITRCENNYGPWQHRQKVIPVFCRMAMEKKPLPVYGDGEHVRSWIHVDDHVDAIWRVIGADAEPGQVWHVAGSRELTNLELAQHVLLFFKQPSLMIEHIDDRVIRPGHDRRYSLSQETSRLASIGWGPKVKLEEGLERTFKWMRENRWWLE